MSERTIDLNGAKVTVKPFGVVHAHDNTRPHQRTQEDWVCLELVRSEEDGDSFNEARFAVRMQNHQAVELASYLQDAARTEECE